MTGALAFAGKAFLGADPLGLRAFSPPEFIEALNGDAGELRKEYVRLFISPSRSPCPPWQSAHTGEGALMGAPHLSALEWYRSFGAEPQNGNEPADHLGLLLLFAARLAGAGVDEETRRRFHADHLAWAPAFCETVGREARQPFFRELALWTKSLLESY